MLMPMGVPVPVAPNVATSALVLLLAAPGAAVGSPTQFVVVRHAVSPPTVPPSHVWLAALAVEQSEEDNATEPASETRHTEDLMDFRFIS
jgi:hypothetical protein